MGQFQFPQIDINPESDVTTATAELANCILQFRRERSRQLGSDLFSDPAWEILLVMQALDADDRGMAPADLHAEMGVGSGTMGRWLSLLIERNLIERRTVGDIESYHLSKLSRQTLADLFGLIRSIL